MSKKHAIRPTALALGAVFTVSLANVTVGNAAENPFSMKSLSNANTTLAEGKCGEGKCGAAKGAMAAEGKCGEGKCGMGRMDADGDGKVTRDEFMKGHETMFDKIDQNADGVIDQSERKKHMKKMKGFMKEGKCGPGKSGDSD